MSEIAAAWWFSAGLVGVIIVLLMPYIVSAIHWLTCSVCRRSRSMFKLWRLRK